MKKLSKNPWIVHYLFLNSGWFSAAKPTWYLQHLHPVQQGRGNGRCGVCSGNKQHLGEVKGYVEVMICEAVVLFWVQDLKQHTETVSVYVINHAQFHLARELMELIMDG